MVEFAMNNSNSTCKGIKKRVLEYFNNEDLADVHFHVGANTEFPSQTFPAHKLILSIGSKVFNTMFNGSVPETSSKIEISDVEPGAFLQLLKYLYGDLEDVHLTDESVISLLYAAKKYDTRELEKYCVDFLESNLFPSNVFTFLISAIFFDLRDTERACWRFIDERTKDVLNGTGIYGVDAETISRILQRSTLDISEIDLFEAVVRWATMECVRTGVEPCAKNRRAALDGAIKYIRFPIMEKYEFHNIVVPSEILTEKEELSLFRFFNSPSMPDTEFIAKRRTGPVAMYCVNRYEEIAWDCCHEEDCSVSEVRFSVSKEIQLDGVVLFDPCGCKARTYYPEENLMTVVIKETKSQFTKSNDGVTFRGDVFSNQFEVTFKSSVLILPNKEYTVTVTMLSVDVYPHRYGIDQFTQTTVQTKKYPVTFSFVNSTDSSDRISRIAKLNFSTLSHVMNQSSLLRTKFVLPEA